MSDVIRPTGTPGLIGQAAALRPGPVPRGGAGAAPGADPGAGDLPPARAAELRAIAERFEGAFLAEMLKLTGVGRMPESFNGGAGEAAFGDFLTREYADAIARDRSVGVADMVFRALVQKETGQ